MWSNTGPQQHSLRGMWGGGIKNVEKITPPFFGSKIINLWFSFLLLSPKSFFPTP